MGGGDVPIAHCAHGDGSPVNAVVKLKRSPAFFMDAQT
jgi:hypothetical protein